MSMTRIPINEKRPGAVSMQCEHSAHTLCTGEILGREIPPGPCSCSCHPQKKTAVGEKSKKPADVFCFGCRKKMADGETHSHAAAGTWTDFPVNLRAW